MKFDHTVCFSFLTYNMRYFSLLKIIDSFIELLIILQDLIFRLTYGNVTIFTPLACLNTTYMSNVAHMII